MDDVRLSNYFAGIDPGPLDVCPAGREIAAALGVPVGTMILLSYWTITKTKFRRPDIDFRDYKALPEVIANGLIIKDRKHSIELIHYSAKADRPNAWRVAVKVTKDKKLLVNMIHRTNDEDTCRLYRRAVRKGTLLRDPKDELARRIADRANSA